MKSFYQFLFITLLLACNESKVTEKKSLDLTESNKKQIIDLSHDYSSETVYWVTAKQFRLDTVFAGFTDKGFYYTANNIETAEHGGTHLDAPIHFAAGKQTVDEIPLDRLMGAGIRIDISDSCRTNVDYQIQVADFLQWEKDHDQQLPENSIVLLYTNHSRFYPDAETYLGTQERGDQAIAKLHFPGLHPEAAKWIVEERKIKAIGIDTPSIDYGQSTHFESHVILLSQNIPVFENVNNLKAVPSKGFHVIALPMKIKGGSGAPLRIIAALD